ncbi:MAG: hypothetical protein LBG46_00160 [Elusimicrobiota bacterium]|jgi:hypothetical protein|nr:hypothetical protein [Elusimicrobiota bacterium]
MKSFAKNITAVFAAAFFLTGAANAANTAAVVKQDGLRVYLDISELPVKPQAGAAFRIVAQTGADIINPKTGKNLGKEIIKQISGQIIQTEELYAIGQLAAQEDVLGLTAEIAAPAQTPDDKNVKTKKQFDTPEIRPLWQSKPIEGSYKAVAAGNISGAGNELVLAFEDNTINLFKFKDGIAQKVAVSQVNPLRKIISLDAADIKGTGKAQIFAATFDSDKFTTFVYEFKDNSLLQTDTIKGIVKGISPNNGARVLYVQDISPISSGFKMTTPAKLIYKNGFSQGEKLKTRKFNLIFGFNLADFKNNGLQNIIYADRNGKLRIQFDKKNNYIESPDEVNFMTTPLRVKFKNETERLPISVGLFQNNEGSIIIAAIENQAKLGMLADKFGSYQNAKLHFLKWTGNSLEHYGSADIGGVVYDIAQAPLGEYARTLIVPFASNAGSTTILLFSAE